MPDFPLKMGELLEVEIEKLTFGGAGLARVKPPGSEFPVVVFVPFSAPGDRLKIKVSQVKKRHAEANIVEILQPGPGRTEAPCPVYGDCGGCDFQHLNYDSQLQSKQKIVDEFLNKFFADGITKTLAILPSPEPFHYRNRAVLKTDGKKLGFYRKNTHEIIDIDKCWLLEKALEAQIPLAKKNLKSDQNSLELSLKDLEPLVSDEEFSESGFSQVNRFQNKNLIERVLQWIDPEAKRIFDLFAGSGNFTFPLIEKFRQQKIIGVELHAGASRIAQQRLKTLKISPKIAEFYNADVGIFLRRFPVESTDTIILDPPRVGCTEEVISSLVASQPSQILYLSCDPAALARDLDRIWLKSDKKYALKQVQCFDMFPQTHHIETLVELRRLTP